MAPVILVAVDKSSRATDALALAAALAAPLDATIAIANVRTPVPQPRLPGNEQVKEDMRLASRDVLREARQTLGDPAGVSEHSVIDRSVPHALCKLAEKTNAGVIVVAQTHHGSVRRIAGVAERLLHGAGRPVAVAPPGLSSSATGGIVRIRPTRSSRSPGRPTCWSAARAAWARSAPRSSAASRTDWSTARSAPFSPSLKAALPSPTRWR